jgi:hypothetical protein
MLRAFGREMATMPGATSKKSILFVGVLAVLESPNGVAEHRRGCCKRTYSSRRNAMNLRSAILFAFAILGTLAMSYRPAWSQGEAGQIAGTVSDKTGAVIPGASVNKSNLKSLAKFWIGADTFGTG